MQTTTEKLHQAIYPIIRRTLGEYSARLYVAQDPYNDLYWIRYNPFTHSVTLTISTMCLSAMVDEDEYYVKSLVNDIIEETNPDIVKKDYEGWQEVKCKWYDIQHFLYRTGQR